MISLGYGVLAGGELQRNTVHSHARGALVNFIHLSSGGKVPLAGMTDEQIRAAFLYAQRNNPGMKIRLALLELAVVEGDVDVAAVNLAEEP